jgi:predicted Zn-dependent protease with MMP-like domain/DnaJ-domain-containing protein 1
MSSGAAFQQWRRERAIVQMYRVSCESRRRTASNRQPYVEMSARWAAAGIGFGNGQACVGHRRYGGDVAETSRKDADQGAGEEADYYAVLGVAQYDDHETIHQAYRRLAKLWHPDRYTYGPPELRERAERRMRAISRAWAELGDPIRRRAYDQRRFRPTWGDSPWQAWQSVREQRMENGAGIFAGMLCVILALPLLVNVLNGSLRESWQVVVASLLILGLATLAGFFFTGDSPLARVATKWAEGEPRGYYDQPAAAYWYNRNADAPAYAFETADANDEDADGAARFDLLVEQALATIPDDFKPYMRNVLVRVQLEPTEEELRQLEVGPGGTLFGLYTGVPLTVLGARAAGTEFVTIYRGPIERYCENDPDRIRVQVQRTVLHEVAHHFGIDHDAMPEWLK